jgi:transcriptional regulator with XRE-family HTH domain
MSAGRPKTAAISALNRIYELRVLSRLTQAQLGAMVGCTGGQIQKLESGRQQITQSMLHRLAKVLGVSVGEIFSAEPPPEDRSEEEALRLVRALPPDQREAWLRVGAVMLRNPAPLAEKLRSA